MGGHQVSSHGSGDDGFDEDGYDESQRAEILEATGDGPSDGIVMVDLDPDLGLDDDQDDADDLEMRDGDVGAETSVDDVDEDDLDEDEIQDEFDDGESDTDEDLDDADDRALRP